MKLLIGGIHRAPIPVDHLANAVEEPTELDANAPTPLVFGLFANLLRTASLANRKQQLNGVAVNHQEEAGNSQKPLVPVLMGDQQALQASAIRQASKQGFVIPFEPAIESAKMASFERKEQADRDQLTGIQFGLTMLGNLFH